MLKNADKAYEGLVWCVGKIPHEAAVTFCETYLGERLFASKQTPPTGMYDWALTFTHTNSAGNSCAVAGVNIPGGVLLTWHHKHLSIYSMVR